MRNKDIMKWVVYFLFGIGLAFTINEINNATLHLTGVWLIFGAGLIGMVMGYYARRILGVR